MGLCVLGASFVRPARLRVPLNVAGQLRTPTRFSTRPPGGMGAGWGNRRTRRYDGNHFQRRIGKRKMAATKPWISPNPVHCLVWWVICRPKPLIGFCANSCYPSVLAAFHVFVD